MVKAQTYLQLANETITAFRGGKWMSFLDTASWMYKYPYPDQVMIYAQRPDATACAQMGLWNKRLGRWIKRGSKGIALLDLSRKTPRLRYVFDIADTAEGRNDAQPVYLWQVRPEHEDAVRHTLTDVYKLQADTLAQLLHIVAAKQTVNFCTVHQDKILQSLTGSSVRDMTILQAAATESATYVLMKRCQMRPEKHLQLAALDVSAFDTAQSVAALGRVVNIVSGAILREIERIINQLTLEVSIVPKEELPQAENHASQDFDSANSDMVQTPLPEIPITAESEALSSTSLNPAPEVSSIAEEQITAPPKTAAKKYGAKAKQSHSRKKVGNLVTLDFDSPPQMTPITTSPEIPAVPIVPPILPAPLSENYRMTAADADPGGPKTKCAQNLAAIRALKSIEAENRAATAQEQDILAKYIGWGGLSQVFDPDNTKWQNEYAELKTTLTPGEYIMARASTLTAFYTPPFVIHAMYSVLENSGFSQGRILEPSCGIGNFFGILPDSMCASNCYGVELDSLSGRIAKQLYPNINIQIKGFEDTKFADDFFDVALGNVPFGSYGLADKRYDAHKFSVHEYFLAKTLDKLRSGGIVAFIISKFLLDKKDISMRRYIAQRADLLGAIRLPSIAFMQYAGTEATMDILFLQKKDAIDEAAAPYWLQLSETADGIPVNRYYADNHPMMMLGKMEYSARMYGDQKGTACTPWPNRNLEELLCEAIGNIQGTYWEASQDVMPERIPLEKKPIDFTEESTDLNESEIRSYSFALSGGDIHYKGAETLKKLTLSQAEKMRVMALIQLRNCVHALIKIQLNNAIDESIREKQTELNRLYDSFIVKYGLISSRANKLAFREDSSYYLLCSLEILDEDGKLERKADMFTKRTIGQTPKITSADTASDALAVSISERGCVDIGFMSSLLQKPGAIEPIIEELKGIIFKDPTSDKRLDSGWQTADEYLSVNVRDKLRIAQEAAKDNPLFEPNVTALGTAQPKDLEAHEIDVQLGTTWIDKKYIQQFVFDLLQTPENLRLIIKVQYEPYTAEWAIAGKRAVSGSDVLSYTTYGTDRMNAYQIIEETLNLRDVRIHDMRTDADGNEKRVLNRKDTMVATQKQSAIKQKFREWIFADAERRQALVSYYNEQFNSLRPRDYDGRHIRYHGMNPYITLRPHQINAIARILYGGNTLLAHVVGAGKTFEMIAAAMESKYLGLCSKSLFVVPNHLTEQWAAEFLRLYPAANILVTTKKDFQKNCRKQFCARIATGNYDAIIIGHSQFEKIPVSLERQKEMLDKQIDAIIYAIRSLKHKNGNEFSIKQMERLKKSLEVRLARLMGADRKDGVITFEELGVDRMFVDEAHHYKNLFLFTKMRNVAGLSTTDAQKSSDMFLKCRYLDVITQGRGIIFATGTPLSNSMTELYTMQRYLQYAFLERNDWLHFDCWASQFGETVTQIELAPEGSGYRARIRFARFFNLPELMNVFKLVADIQTADMLNLPTPEAEYKTIVAQPTAEQREMLQALSERARKVNGGTVDPHIDNMLAITIDGRKLGLDQRLMNPLLPDAPNSKLNLCVKNVLRIWRETASERLTQLIFSDFSTPNADKFNVYDDIKAKLLLNGVHEKEIAFIHDFNSETQKKELFAKVRTGKVRILMGSTAKMGAGTNVQDRLIASHDLDCPWRPGDLEQRGGRIVRQGNLNSKVYLYRYVTQGTFDSYLYQTIEHKQRFISQIMTSKSPVRSCEDVDQSTLNYAEIKALCAGNPVIKEKMELDIEVARLKMLKADFQNRRYRLEDRLMKTFPKDIRECETMIHALNTDLATLHANPTSENNFMMTLQGICYTKRAEAEAALLDLCTKISHLEKKEIGTFRGLELRLAFSASESQYHLILCGTVRYDVALKTRGNIARIENALEYLPKNLQTFENNLMNLHQQVKNAKAELEKSFPQEEELTAKYARLIELNSALDIHAAKEVPD